MAEWSKAQHWKCCVGQLTEGSNPSLSVVNGRLYWHNGIS